jgi:cytidylate kinase
MLEEVLRRQTQRDTEDANRPVGALVPAADAVLVVTDGMTPEEVVAHLEYIVRQRQPSGRTAHAAEQTPWQEAEGQERGP